MTAEILTGAFAPQGAIALRQMHVEPETGDTVRCRVGLIIDQQPVDLETSAPGAIGAMSELLYGLGAGVEIVSLHHQNDGAYIAAYLRCRRDGRTCWAYGRAHTGDEATARALISAANQLTDRVGD
ncbi:MAG: hypothetical protein QM809_02750 [Gordonia sp. (in: high G+C Gram-positive bacteria)]|uniref:hypothetical protein n=1 Tax=Gordonia sp. (in: high G+C Gram-positive bacteria) TaxID=84139 RepID=UPI0039E3DE29